MEKSLTFRIDESLQQRFEGLVSKLGLDKGNVLRDAISTKLDELEALCASNQRAVEYQERLDAALSWSEEEKMEFLKDALVKGLASGVSSRNIDEIFNGVKKRHNLDV